MSVFSLPFSIHTLISAWNLADYCARRTNTERSELVVSDFSSFACSFFKAPYFLSAWNFSDFSKRSVILKHNVANLLWKYLVFRKISHTIPCV
jgi:hypothetical protein